MLRLPSIHYGGIMFLKNSVPLKYPIFPAYYIRPPLKIAFWPNVGVMLKF